MSYVALYRKFRPTVFDDVKGQDALVTTLKNQIKSGRIGHAFLFCGTRGTGKTSVAKIMAKAVNCEAPVDGNPCGKCDMCVHIASGSSLNVIEIDAASNNGVDNIREIRDEVAYRPPRGKYKVYIIDEVHMLSSGAFNALLKTLEEPPAHVIFILATTEVHKIPVTILSRCQRYDFKRISVEVIRDRLMMLAEKEGWDVEEKGMAYIARAADGSMRDSLSLLDQCAAFHPGERLTYDHILEIVGAVDTEVYSTLFECLARQSVKDVMNIVDEVVCRGKELSLLTLEFTWYLRNLLVLKSGEDMEECIDASTEHMAQMKKQAEMAEYNDLIRYIRIFSGLGNQMRYSVGKRVLLEVALMKICRPQMETDLSSLEGRIKDLEKRMAGVPVRKYAGNTAEKRPEEKPAEKSVRSPASLPENIRTAPEIFEKIKKRFDGFMGEYLEKAFLEVEEDNTLMLVFADDMGVDFFKREGHMDQVKSMMEKELGAEISLRARAAGGAAGTEPVYQDLREVVVYDEIEEEDF